MRNTLSAVMILAGVGLIGVTVGMSWTHRTGATTMYWLGLGGTLAVGGLLLRRQG